MVGNTVLLYNGCYWHGHTCRIDRDRKIKSDSRFKKALTTEEAYQNMLEEIELLKLNGYEVTAMWGCEWARLKKTLDPKDYEPMPVVDMRGSYFGGRVGPTAVYDECMVDEEIHYIDAVSMYPTVMHNEFYPIGHPTRLDDMPVDDYVRGLLKDDGSVFGKSCIDILPPLRFPGKNRFDCINHPLAYLPVLPERVRGDNDDAPRLMFENIAKFKASFDTPEILRAVRAGWRIIKVYRHWQFERDYVFKDYVRVFMKKKLEASGVPAHKREEYISESLRTLGVELNRNKLSEHDNNGMRTVAKLALNSSYGKLGERDQYNETAIVTSPQEWLKITTNDNHELIDWEFFNDKCAVVEYKIKDESKKVNYKTAVHMASFITCYARCMLYDKMQEIMHKGGKLIYCDTDSVFFKQRKQSDGKLLVETGDTLGSWTDELKGHTIKKFLSMGPKSYYYEVVPCGKPKCTCNKERLANCNCAEQNLDHCVCDKSCHCVSKCTLGHDYKVTKMKGAPKSARADFTFENFRDVINGGIDRYKVDEKKKYAGRSSARVNKCPDCALGLENKMERCPGCASLLTIKGTSTQFKVGNRSTTVQIRDVTKAFQFGFEQREIIISQGNRIETVPWFEPNQEFGDPEPLPTVDNPITASQREEIIRCGGVLSENFKPVIVVEPAPKRPPLPAPYKAELDKIFKAYDPTLTKDRYFKRDTQSGGKIMFRISNDLDKFVSRYMPLTRHPTPPNWYEYIVAQRDVAEYYDIDFKTDMSVEDMPNKANDILWSFLENRNFIAKNPIMLDDMLVLDSSRKGKLSLHIIVQTTYFTDNQILKRFAAKLYRELAEEGSEFNIDTSVYSNGRCMRILHSAKYGSTSTLKVFQPHKYRNTTLRGSLITLESTTGRRCIDNEVDASDIPKAPIPERIAGNDHALMSCEEFVKAHPEFVVGQRSRDHIRLDRVAPSMCFCEPSDHHSTENGFIQVINGHVYAGCFGHPRQKIPIGRL